MTYEIGSTESKEEMDRAWTALAAKEINRGQTQPRVCESEHGEVWQHMCCFRLPGRIWFHQFRHRQHPNTGQREIINIQVRDWRSVTSH